MSAESIKIYVGMTDLEWFEYLSTQSPDGAGHRFSSEAVR